MTTIAVIGATLLMFTWVLIQEWRQLTYSNRYAVKLERARANRKEGVA